MNLSLTPDAASHLAHDLSGRILRIAFTTGCGGSGYRLSYAESANDGDHVENIDGIRVALDDEEEDGYLLDHPDAVTAVWCG